MAGLTFSNDLDSPSPQACVGGWTDGWLESLGQRAKTTRAAYVEDVGVVAESLARLCKRPRVAVLESAHHMGAWIERVREPDNWRDEQLKYLIEHLEIPARSTLRCVAALETLELANLAPRYLARVMNRLSVERSASNLHRKLAAWGSLMQYLVGQEVLAENPAKSPAISLPPIAKRLPAALSLDELRRIFEAAKQDDRRARSSWPARDLAVVAMLASTGMRASEICGLRLGDLTQESGEICRIRVTGKGSKDRVLLVHHEAHGVLGRYRAEREALLGEMNEGSPIFVGRDGRAMTPSMLWQLVARLFTRAGVARRPGAMAHSLRHSFATHALDSGSSIVEIQRLMGHASLETTRKYLDVVGSGLDDAISSHPTRQLLS